MRSSSLRLFIALVVGVAIAASAFSAVVAKPSQRSKRTHSLPDPVTVAFVAITQNSADPHENLQKACRRSDFKLLALGLEGIRSRISQPKGEFETNAEYAERTGKLETVLNPEHPIIVCQTLDDNEDAPFEYNADREVFKGTFQTSQNVWRDVKKLGSYVSRTRMGIKATVKASAELEYNVRLAGNIGRFGHTCSRKDETTFSSSYLPYTYEVPVPRGDAPRVKARGYLVFIGRLISPFIEKSDIRGSPTLDDPYDVYEHQLVVHFAPDEILLVGPGGERLWECSLVAATTTTESGRLENHAPLPNTTGGKIWLQLASAADPGALAGQYARIRARGSDLFDGIRAYIARSPDRARLLIGPFRSPADAQVFADDLESKGIAAFRWTNSAKDQISPVAGE